MISSAAGESRGGERPENRPGCAPARVAGLLGQGAGRVETVQHVRGHHRRGEQRGRPR